MTRCKDEHPHHGQMSWQLPHARDELDPGLQEQSKLEAFSKLFFFFLSKRHLETFVKYHFWPELCCEE